jgi:hypothetical protein
MEWVCGRSFGGIVGSNPTGGMDICVVCCTRAVIWNISDMKKEGRIQGYKMDQRNKQDEEKNPARGVYVCLLRVLFVVR